MRWTTTSTSRPTCARGDGLGPSLYVHVPFCESKCAYCDFASWEGRLGEEGAWSGRIEREIGLRGRQAGQALSSVFLGGGTPSALSEEGLGDLCRSIRSHFRLDPGAEWSMEANPVSLTPAKLRLAMELGVDRISLGVQSLDDALLGRMGRAHDREGAIRALDLVAGSGISWSADLIFALPGQTIEQFLSSLDGILRWGPDHLSFYGLTVEPGTRFWKLRQGGSLPEVDEEDYVRMYEAGVERLESAGLLRYEVSNFARPGRECRHNRAYWDTRSTWLCAGNSAHGYAPHVRVRNPRGLDAWSEWVDRGCPEEERDPEILTAEQRWMEEWFLGLRTEPGVDLERLRRDFPANPRPSRSLERRQEAGHLRVEGGRAKLVGAGWLLLDAIAVELAS